MASKKTANSNTTNNKTTQTDKKQLELVLNNHRNVKQSQKPQKLTGRGGSANFPASRDRYKGSPEVVKKLLSETITAYKMPKVSSNAELAQRISDYFSMCCETGQIPTVEEMALSTGYSIATFFDWEKGRNKGFGDGDYGGTSEVIKKAKSFMRTFDSKMAIAGQMDFLLYCFRGKNYYDMTDKQEVVVTPNQNPIGDPRTQQALLDEYLEKVDDA